MKVIILSLLPLGGLIASGTAAAIAAAVAIEAGPVKATLNTTAHDFETLLGSLDSLANGSLIHHNNGTVTFGPFADHASFIFPWDGAGLGSKVHNIIDSIAAVLLNAFHHRPNPLVWHQSVNNSHVHTALHPEYNVNQLTWVVQSTPDGPKHHLNGNTVQDVVAQLQELDPLSYMAMFDSFAHGMTATDNTTTSLIAKREEQDAVTNISKCPACTCPGDLVPDEPKRHKCVDPKFWWDPKTKWFPPLRFFADKRLTQKGIDYLRTVGGEHMLPPGPEACSRVSCSWQSAIHWCNDRRTPQTLPDLGPVADAAHLDRVL